MCFLLINKNKIDELCILSALPLCFPILFIHHSLSCVRNLFKIFKVKRRGLRCFFWKEKWGFYDKRKRADLFKKMLKVKY